MNIEISQYLSGITNLASSLSDWIGPSYVSVYCLDKDDWQEEFSKYFKIDKLNIEKIDYTFTTLLKEIFGDNSKMINSIKYWFNYKIGMDTNIYIINDSKIIDKLSCSEGGLSPFYFVEDVYFIEFRDYIVCFIMGNNE